MRYLVVVLFAPFIFAVEAPSPRPEPMDQETFNRLEIGSDALDDRLLSIVKTRNGGEIGNGLIRLQQAPEFSWADFHLLEGRLRKLGTDIYLVAAPIRFHKMVTANVKSVAEDNWTSRAILGSSAGDLPYFLWVEVNGREKFLQKLNELEIDSEASNLENLKRTGILMPKKR